MTISATLWQDCHLPLQDKLSFEDFNLWLKPLQAGYEGDHLMILYVANFYVKKQVDSQYLPLITSLCCELTHNPQFRVEVQVGEKPKTMTESVSSHPENQNEPLQESCFQSNLDPNYIFENFVQGKSNQWAKAAGEKVAGNPGDKMNNPLFLYGGTGLGKTHLLHAIGNQIVMNNKKAKVMYLHAERFMHFYVKALKNNKMPNFKDFYRNVDALLIDDIQFFADKEKTQEEFFHIFNSLFERNRQIILTSDRYPKEIANIEDRLKSRFGWGLSVPIEPPDLETRVAILMKKAEERNFHLPLEVATFIGQKLRTNVRELEGALNRVQANAEFTGKEVTIDFVRDALRDLFALQDKLVTVENILKTVAEYFHVKVADIKSKSRKRTIARPRQIAMALAKELTNRSLPEIGHEFGRDHTTVLHACKAVVKLRAEDPNIEEDWTNLIRTLSV